VRNALFIVALLVLIPDAAMAQEPDLGRIHAEAQRLAKEAAADGRADEALAILTAANARGEDPVSWFLIGRIHAAFDRCPLAAAAFTRAATAQNDAPLVQLANEELDKLRAVCPGTVLVLCAPPELAVSVADVPRACGATFELPAGQYIGSAWFQEHTTQKKFEVVALETTELSLEVTVPDEEPAAPVVSASEPPDVLLYAGWPVLVAGVGVLGTSVYLLMEHEDDVRTLEDADAATFDRLRPGVQDRRELIPVLYGVGGVLVAGGVTMLLVHWLWDTSAGTPEEGSVQVLVGPASMGIVGTF
jgi:hypothetical protein